jgi:hypothetical protein
VATVTGLVSACENAVSSPRGPDGKFVHHCGSVLGFWSYNGFYPARDTVVVILSNLDTVQINPISAELNGLAGSITRLAPG